MNARNRQGPTSCILALAVCSLAIGLTGCSAPLLSPDEPRSPFDRYDAVRNQRADQYYFDDYGRRRPDLAKRLSPRD